ncbi:MAG: 3-phosphoserine/phosphohydroxythreonine transaminase [Clostridia bacterium]|nr:3-phosphoserine/phosphohydroxythreonine transaminase [Clostridia bacterium]
MSRVYNFSAGPTVLPVSVLEQAQKDLVEYKNSGMSVMEMSHRSKDYQAIFDQAKSSLIDIMSIPDNYEVLFLQGGASTQFAMIPMNLISKTGKMDIVNTGTWTQRAMEEAKKFGEVNMVASSKDKMYSYIPELDKSMFSKDASYVHIASNNTIYGTRYTTLPDTGDIPLVADMSSNILSEVYDVSKFGIIFAGAQKNMGPSGVCVVIIRKNLIGHAMSITPTMLDYKIHVENDSMYNTPPTFSIYICGLVYQWVKDQGGVKELQRINESKANLLYDFLDQSSMFRGTVVKKDRSLMNIPFVTGNEELDDRFIKQAKQLGLVNLKGHRSVGGMRASIYNAMPYEGVKTLVEFLKKFEMENK